MARNTSPVTIWHKIINKLNRAKLDYVLVGGAALVVHGVPRSTLDLDIFVPAKEKVLHKLFDIADVLGLKCKEAAILNISHLPKLFSNQWICFSYRGQDVLDVFFADEGEFRERYKNSVLKKDKHISIRVASLDDIMVMKKRIARPIDLADVSLIKESRKISRKKRHIK
jgi:predicted DNA binding CopG/RHH family protein